MMKHKFLRFFAVVNAWMLCTVSLCACTESQDTPSIKTDEIQTTSVSSEAVTTRLSEAISTAIQTPPEPVQADPLSFDYQDFNGDLDAFVYGLIMNEYELYYNVFHAAIDLPDGETIYGIGYTDYAEYYEADDGTGYFPAGFFALIGEPEIPEDALEKGLEIIDLELENSSSKYVYAYSCQDAMNHCVVWGQYLQYGVNGNGAITYKAETYQRGHCNESLGALYSYDEGKTVFDPDVGEYIPLTGVSLSEKIDYAALEAEVNRILDEQDYNYSKSDIETTVSFAQGAVNSYLLSLQAETFLGVPVAELIEKASKLNAMECIRITPDGMVEVPISGEIPQEPDALSKWLVGIGSGIAIASTIALNVFVPASTPLTGAVTSAAIDVFMQVVVENHAVQNINWKKVAVSATSGALLAWACPLAASGVAGSVTKLVGKEAVGKLAGFATLTLGNAVVSGATSAAMGVIDGKKKDEIFDSFLIGAAIGGASTVAVAAVSKVVGAGAKSLSKLAQKTKPGKWLADKAAQAGKFISDHQVHLKNQSLENILHPKSIQEAAREAYNTLKNEEAIKAANLLNNVKQLPSDDNKFIHKIDGNGMPVSKAQVLENGGNCYLECSDPNIKTEWESFGVTKIEVVNGQPDLEPISYFTMNTPITGNREANYNDFLPKIAKAWNQTPSTIPERVKNTIPENELKRILSSDSNIVSEMKNILKATKLTPHEVIR